MILSLLLLAAIAAEVLRNSEGDVLNSTFASNHSQFVDISLFIKWSTMLNSIVSVLIFCLTLRLLRPLASSRVIIKFLAVLEEMRATLFCYIPLFSLIVCAFSMLFVLLLSTSFGSYEFTSISFLKALMLLFNCLIGVPIKWSTWINIK